MVAAATVTAGIAVCIVILLVWSKQADDKMKAEKAAREPKEINAEGARAYRREFRKSLWLLNALVHDYRDEAFTEEEKDTMEEVRMFLLIHDEEMYDENRKPVPADG